MHDHLEKIFNSEESGLDPDAPENVWPAPAAAEGKKKLRSAAVLVPLINYDSGMKVLLTQRTETMPDHAGQIAFPGGGQRKGEISPEHTALRETQEEIGIDKNEISILGKITPLFIPVTGFMITPFVSYISKKPKTILDEIEVAELLSVNIRDLLNNDILIMDRDINGSSVSIPYFSLNNHQVWGATSMVLSELKDIIQLV